MGNTTGGLGLDTYAYIGLAVDVVLAVIAGVLIVWWRKRLKQRYQRRFKASYYGSDTRTDVATDGSVTPQGHKTEDGRQIHPVLPFNRVTAKSAKSGFTETTEVVSEVEGDFAFLNGEMTPSAPASTASEHRSISQPGHAVIMDPTGTHTQGTARESIVRNPLVITSSVQRSSSHDDAEDVNNADIAVTTYYTYPSDELAENETGTGSELNPPSRPSVSGNEADQESDDDSEARVTPPPPRPPPPHPPNDVTPSSLDEENNDDFYNTLHSKPPSIIDPDYQGLSDVRAEAQEREDLLDNDDDNEVDDNEDDNEDDNKDDRNHFDGNDDELSALSSMKFLEEEGKNLQSVEVPESTDVM